MNKSLKAKILTLSLIGLISVNSYIYNNNNTKTTQVSATLSIEELEAKKLENIKKLEELKAEIANAQTKYDSIVSDENAKLEYKESLNKKIELQNQNISYVVSQIDSLDALITENNNRILELQADILIKEADIGRSMELFKQRLRVSYMSGNNNIAAVLTGSSSFYDLLAKMELVAKVAERDDEVIETLRTQLEELDELKKTLEVKKNELDVSMADATEKKKEFDVLLDKLSEDYENTQRELDALNDDKEELVVDIATKESAIAQKEKEYENIMADLAAAREALRIEESKKADSISASKSVEESKRIEESKRAEEEKKKQEAANQQNPVPAVTTAPSSPAPPPSTTAAPVTSDALLWPTPGHYVISSYYGYRSFDNSFHKGIDITGGIAGAAIVAVDDGVVVRVSNTCSHNFNKTYSCGCGGGYGNYLTIAHSDGVYSTLYAHCESVIVSAGQTVAKGQTVAYAGTTGYSTGPHLHFEIHKNGSHIDPLTRVSY